MHAPFEEEQVDRIGDEEPTDHPVPSGCDEEPTDRPVPSEEEIDRALEGSFPASDPPSFWARDSEAAS